ncbi:hypothetical protein H206_02438 [Candidatus Electrothrix aarhusensis]|uniref:RelA/SpoT domain-containing protein n=1 Tax=Candidatus Electrothrix aarhusensis TaxID=1859131 RepID=A0A3S3QVV3_9BACT|nr:hypothetical protein H206_02438 [Candidatus Electrothrix aarhusensis]
MKVEHSIRVKYQELWEKYSALKTEVGDLLLESCEENGWFFEHRLKSEENYASKLSTGRYSDAEIDDFYACTIVVPNLRYVPNAVELVSACYDIFDKKPGETVKSRPTDFSFNSIRMLCRLKKGVTEKFLDSCVFEVQVKTLLEHACSKATHDFSYKGGTVSWGRERLAAQIKAVLDNADLSILEMESLSSSSFLDQKNESYEKMKAIVLFIRNEWEDSSDNIMPSDLKRLAEVTAKILSASNLDIIRLKNAVKKETDEGRGKNTKNQSIYSILLQSLINQERKNVMKYLQGKKQKCKQQILIPPEIELPEGTDIKTLKNAVFLPR